MLELVLDTGVPAVKEVCVLYNHLSDSQKLEPRVALALPHTGGASVNQSNTSKACVK